jgi:hypothetical protein
MSPNLISHERINSYTKKRVEFNYYFLLKINVLIKLRFIIFSKPERIELSKSRL